MSSHEYEPIVEKGIDEGGKGDMQSGRSTPWLTVKSLSQASTQIIPCLFAVFINLLDAVTFGTCFFPSTLGETGSLGISLFLFSTLVVQVVLIVMSSFQYGLGTSMAENIPFIHTMTQGVFDSLEATHTVQEMLPTVLVTVCLSTVINGLAFFSVGYLKLGYILHYFPRHVILGMTFGFGIFLLSTCFQVTTGIAADIHIVSTLFHLDSNSLIQLGVVTVVEIFLRLISHYRIGGEMAGPLVMIVIPLGFYCYLFTTGTTFDDARQANWLFPQASSDNRWYDMWLPFLSSIEATDEETGISRMVMGFSLIEWSVVFQQFPIILSLMTFTLLLVPVRIPTLSMLTGDDVDFDEELKAQGMGNIISGVFGSVHNYLSYSNSVFFYNVGGWGKTSQGAIAFTTLILFIVGPQIINFVPRIIAGVIMFHLGYDLVNDAVWLSRPALDSQEYMSVLFVGTVVMIFGFVTGIIAGGVSACVTFVLQSSNNSSVRGVFTGEVVRSNTAWTGKHRDKLERGLQKKGIYVIQLQGHIFFGNIQQVIRSVEKIIIEACEKASIDHNTTSMAEEELPSLSPDIMDDKKAITDVVPSFSLDELDLYYPTRRTSCSITSPLDYGTYTSASSSLNKGQLPASTSRVRSHSDAISIHRSNPMPGNLAPLHLLKSNAQEANCETEADALLGSSENLSRNSSTTNDHSRFPEFVVLDCSFVTGFDANASVGLFKLRNRLENQELGSSVPLPIYLFFAGVQESMRDTFNVHINKEISSKNKAESDAMDDDVHRLTSAEEVDSAEEIDIDEQEDRLYSSGKEDKDINNSDEKRSSRRLGRAPGDFQLEDVTHGNDYSPIRNNEEHSPKMDLSSAFAATKSESGEYSSQVLFGQESFGSIQDNSSLASELQHADEAPEENISRNFFSFLPGFSKTSKKKKKEIRKKKKKSGGDPLRDTHFHLDVNTALQSVEEHIIARVESPTKHMSQSNDIFSIGSSSPHDSFIKHATEPPIRTTSSTSSSAQELEKSFIFPPEFEMVSPLQQITVPSQQYPMGQGLGMVGSPPTDHHSIPLIASGGMAALSLQSSFAGSPAPGLLSPCKQVEKSSNITQTITGRLRRLSLPTAFLKTENKVTVSPLHPPPEQHQTTDTASSNSGNSDVSNAADMTLLSVSNDHEDHSSALRHALDKEKAVETAAELVKADNNQLSSAILQSPAESSHVPLSLHIPEPPVPPEVLKNVVIPVDKRPILTHEEFKQKKLIRKMVFELDLNWRDEDYPVIKRLSWYLLKDIKHVQKDDFLWTGNEKAVAMGLLISGRLEAVTAPSKTSSPSFFGSHGGAGGGRTLQVIMPGTLIGELGLLCGVNHSRTIVAKKNSVVALLSRKSLAEIEKFDLALLCLLQRIALKTAAGRSKELMLFSAGAMGPT